MQKVGNIALSVVAALMLASCSSLPTSVKVCDVDLESISMKGLRSVTAMVMIEIDNPSKDIELSSIQGNLILDGKTFANISVEDVTVPGGTCEKYSFPVKLDLDSSQGTLSAVAFLSVGDFSELALEGSFCFSCGGKRPRHVICKELPLAKVQEIKSGKEVLKYISIKR